eukprot:8325600-Pyramimonas_sp.AAC.1
MSITLPRATEAPGGCRRRRDDAALYGMNHTASDGTSDASDKREKGHGVRLSSQQRMSSMDLP